MNNHKGNITDSLIQEECHFGSET